MSLKIERRFTQEGVSPYASIAFRVASSEICNPDGSIVFRAEDIEVPATWSQVAIDVLAQKYFRKAGVPKVVRPVPEEGVPAWLARRVADETALAQLPKEERFGGERSAKQVFDRLAGTWTYWGWKGAILRAKRMRGRLWTSCAICSPPRSLRRIRRNGSTPACSGPTASTVRRRVIGTSMRRPARPSLDLGLRAAAAARLFHPEHQGRSRQRRRDHGLVGARGAAVQVRLGHRHQLFDLAR